MYFRVRVCAKPGRAKTVGENSKFPLMKLKLPGKDPKLQREDPKPLPSESRGKGELRTI